MPANLPPQYIKLEEECRREKDPRRRLDLLQQMFAEIPKHKGTSHLQGELKSKISKTKQQLRSAKKSGGTRQVALEYVPREGAGQFVLFGAPNAGKSSIVGALTHAHVTVEEWPFATRKPVPGMAKWENVQLQLVDTPSIAPEYCETYVFNIIRTCDMAVLVLSLGNDDILEDYDYVVNRVHEGNLRLEGLVEPDPNLPTAMPKQTIIVATGHDRPDAAMRLSLLTDTVGGRVAVFPVSIPEKAGLDPFLKCCFTSLELLRVYSKAPGQAADYDDPILVPHGGRVADAATVIHKDFAQNLHHARLWSATNPASQGQRVPADHRLEEGDVLEFHI